MPVRVAGEDRNEIEATLTQRQSFTVQELLRSVLGRAASRLTHPVGVDATEEYWHEVRVALASVEVEVEVKIEVKIEG